MDFILLDVPCSGTGTYRRNPDMKWKFSIELLNELLNTQREIFKTALEYLKDDGKILYSTCSLLPEENEQQINYFQKQYALNIKKPILKTIPTSGGTDGFFAAILEKA